MLLIANLINPQQHMVDQMIFFSFRFLLVVLGEENKREREKNPILDQWNNLWANVAIYKIKGNKRHIWSSASPRLFLLSVFCTPWRYTPRKNIDYPHVTDMYTYIYIYLQIFLTVRLYSKLHWTSEKSRYSVPISISLYFLNRFL